MTGAGFTFTISSTALDEDYRPAENTRITTNFATARRLAQTTGDRFSGLDHEATPEGAVFLANATAWLDCSVETEIAAGDHDIVLFRLHRATVAEGIPPLVFHSSAFHTLAPIGPRVFPTLPGTDRPG